jgi:hypothetical protein
MINYPIRINENSDLFYPVFSLSLWNQQAVQGEEAVRSELEYPLESIS